MALTTVTNGNIHSHDFLTGFRLPFAANPVASVDYFKNKFNPAKIDMKELPENKISPKALMTERQLSGQPKSG
ncbi:MAG: hypothetical protein MI976_00815 [Pseudomonadales bacterium]|nr:hypothetical protein [Pseudomonadales bacterium]